MSLWDLQYSSDVSESLGASPTSSSRKVQKRRKVEPMHRTSSNHDRKFDRKMSWRNMPTSNDLSDSSLASLPISSSQSDPKRHKANISAPNHRKLLKTKRKYVKHDSWLHNLHSVSSDDHVPSEKSSRVKRNRKSSSEHSSIDSFVTKVSSDTNSSRLPRSVFRATAKFVRRVEASRNRRYSEHSDSDSQSSKLREKRPGKQSRVHRSSRRNGRSGGDSKSARIERHHVPRPSSSSRRRQHSNASDSSTVTDSLSDVIDYRVLKGSRASRAPRKRRCESGSSPEYKSSSFGRSKSLKSQPRGQSRTVAKPVNNAKHSVVIRKKHDVSDSSVVKSQTGNHNNIIRPRNRRATSVSIHDERAKSSSRRGYSEKTHFEHARSRKHTIQQSRSVPKKSHDSAFNSGEASQSSKSSKFTTLSINSSSNELFETGRPSSSGRDPDRGHSKKSKRESQSHSSFQSSENKSQKSSRHDIDDYSREANGISERVDRSMRSTRIEMDAFYSMISEDQHPKRKKNHKMPGKYVLRRQKIPGKSVHMSDLGSQSSKQTAKLQESGIQPSTSENQPSNPEKQLQKSKIQHPKPDPIPPKSESHYQKSDNQHVQPENQHPKPGNQPQKSQNIHLKSKSQPPKPPARVFKVGQIWDVNFGKDGWQIADVYDGQLYSRMSFDMILDEKTHGPMIYFRSSFIGEPFGAGPFKISLARDSENIAELYSRTKTVEIPTLPEYNDSVKIIIGALNANADISEIIHMINHRCACISSNYKIANLFWAAHNHSRVDVMRYLSRFWVTKSISRYVVQDTSYGPNATASLSSAEMRIIDCRSHYVLHSLIKDENMDLLKFYLSREFAKEQPEIFRVLTEKRSQFDRSSIGHQAAEVGNPEILRLLVSRQVLVRRRKNTFAVNPKTVDGCTILHVLVMSAGADFSPSHRRSAEIICGDMSVKELNDRTECGDSAVSLCVRQGNVEMLRYLVTKWSCKLHHRSTLDCNALHIAFRDGSVEMAKAVVKLIASVHKEFVCFSENSKTHRLKCTAVSCLGQRLDAEGASLWERVRERPELRFSVRS
eukprot:429192_1